MMRERENDAKVNVNGKIKRVGGASSFVTQNVAAGTSTAVNLVIFCTIVIFSSCIFLSFLILSCLISSRLNLLGVGILLLSSFLSFFPSCRPSCRPCRSFFPCPSPPFTMYKTSFGNLSLPFSFSKISQERKTFVCNGDGDGDGNSNSNSDENIG